MTQLEYLNSDTVSGMSQRPGISDKQYLVVEHINMP